MSGACGNRNDERRVEGARKFGAFLGIYKLPSPSPVW